MGGVLRLRTRGGGRDFEPDELAGVAGTKKNRYRIDGNDYKIQSRNNPTADLQTP